MAASKIKPLLNKTTDELQTLAKVAEQAERYTDMCKFMHELFTKKCKALANGEAKLEVEERNLLSVAYKNVVGAKRQSWRTLSQSEFTPVDAPTLQKFQTIVEQELEDVCNEVLTLLKDGPVKLLETNPSSMQDESGVFYLKMCGDYYRYLAEFHKGDKEKKAKENAKEYYNKAMKMAKEKLPETHPTRLGLALNFSVCYYEILKEKKEACKLAKESFDKAIEKLDTLNDASYKDSTLIMQLLRDNLTLWTQDDGGAEPDEGGNADGGAEQ